MTKVAFTAPHALAAEIGLDLLKQGVSAVDAMIAAAAAITVAYPHMNSIGGDGFWLIQKPGAAPFAIDACGMSGVRADASYFTSRHHTHIPSRGTAANVTVGGTVAGWQLARELVSQKLTAQNNGSTTNLPVSELLQPAINLAKNGVPVSASLASASRKVLAEIETLTSSSAQSLSSISTAKESVFDEYKRVFSDNGKPLTDIKELSDTEKLSDKSILFKNPDLALTLEQLAHAGLDDFYRGDLAHTIGTFFEGIDAPLGTQDLHGFYANEVTPLKSIISKGKLYNLPAPTQGVASLLILAIYDALYHEGMDESESAHLLVEATKQAFLVRDRFMCDPSRMSMPTQDLLSKENVQRLAKNISHQALSWPYIAEHGDTVWMGCTDKDGVMVSFIQSIYWEFGSAVVIPKTGIVWNNRGSSFSLDVAHHNSIIPQCKPLHTLNPALAVLNDGRRMVYGTMGGEGQPQTQAALFTRKFYQNKSLKESINQGRWLLGRTWGEQNTDLKMERDFLDNVEAALLQKGHKIQPVPPSSEMMGHAGAIILDKEGNMECASDKRSDGAGLVASI